MRLQFTARFQRAYSPLDDAEAELVGKALRLMASDLRHPSLHVKKMQGVQDIWEARASHTLRLTFELQGDILQLRTVGSHDAALKNP